MENPYTIRHYIPETDLSPLSRMLTEIESMDHDGEDTSEEYLRAALAWPGYHPDQNVWVAEADGKLVGHSVALEQPSQQCTLYVVVHPSQRRNGLGGQLLDLALERARAVRSRSIIVHANEQNNASNLFLKKHDFVPGGSSGSLKARAEIEFPPFEFPAGFALKQYSEVNEPRILLKALNDCYRGMWGHQHNDNPTEEELKSPRFLKYYDADDIFLLFDEKDSIFGICSLKSQGKKEGSGEISDLLDGPGIIPTHREESFQQPLVLAGIQHLRKKGVRPITLEFWGDNEDAINIYRSLGFEMVNHLITYHKELE
jgi:mycothiol synthase